MLRRRVTVRSKAKGARVTPPEEAPSVAPYFQSPDGDFFLYQGDCIELLPSLGLNGRVDLVFADPPYFLSNDGITCQAGRMVSVNKGQWDRLGSIEEMHEFNRRWLLACRECLSPNATIWVSGTRHVIFSVGFAMQQIGFKLLNEIAWEKPNPPPNLSCRYFTHSTETILWAARDGRSKHTFNYQMMREMAGGKQMKSVWTLPSPSKTEKNLGSHPTQKPLALLERIVLSSSNKGDLVLDPFVGSCTTGLAALRHQRRFVGIETDKTFLDLSLKRFQAQASQGKLF